jgi:hypothetical protein
MAAIVAALDNICEKRLGENGHVEYGWSNSVREKIVQLNFQITRTDESGLNRLREVLVSILSELDQKIKSSDNNNIIERTVSIEYLSLLYRMIGHTRDVIEGKGEFALSYMMIRTWYDYYPSLAEFALNCLVYLETAHPYGSWKDIKYFCEYCKSQGDTIAHPLIQYCIKLINSQLAIDVSAPTNISLAAKWVPREKAAFGWLFQELATNYYNKYMISAIGSVNPESYDKAVLKCKTQYRKLLTALNKRIDTVQIKQCNKSWKDIDFSKVTSITISKQKKAFLNIRKNGETRYPDTIDRELCATNFNQHIQKAVRGEIEIKGKRVGMVDFVKQALELSRKNGSSLEVELLNSQWRDNSTQTGSLGKMIAMVDVSGSMEGDPMNAAIGLGIRIAENSVLGKRVMTFSQNPTWVNLDDCEGFVSQVTTVARSEWGMNTNFFKALDLILDAIITNKLPATDVQDMVLVIILSDMQIDAGDRECKNEVMYDRIKTKYSDAGMRVNGTPYKPPHIVFWNLRSTEGFPTSTLQPNASMMSGFSPALLNAFCEDGMSSFESCTPWSVLEKSLDNERYKILSKKLSDELF